MLFLAENIGRDWAFDKFIIARVCFAEIEARGLARKLFEIWRPVLPAPFYLGRVKADDNGNGVVVEEDHALRADLCSSRR